MLVKEREIDRKRGKADPLSRRRQVEKQSSRHAKTRRGGRGGNEGYQGRREKRSRRVGEGR